MAQRGNPSMALNSQNETFNPWIIDFGASYHMTSNATLFHTFTSCFDNFMVRIDDGSLSKVAGIGLVVISSSLT